MAPQGEASESDENRGQSGMEKENEMSAVERIMVPGLLEPVSHYCHVVRAGDHVWLSGMVGARRDRNDLPESVEEQFRIALGAIDTALRAAGGTGPANIVKVTVYLTDVNDRAKINPIREEYFGEHRPASTLVEVSALVSPAMKVEIEAVAYIGD